MTRDPLISLSAPVLALLVAGCAEGTTSAPVTRDDGGDLPLPEYMGVETRLLKDDLVNFRVTMTGATLESEVHAYAQCAAAQYALIRGYGFARHLRTDVNETSGIWRADAVYTISPALPDGLKTIDAEVTVSDCVENGIPTV